MPLAASATPKTSGMQSAGTQFAGTPVSADLGGALALAVQAVEAILDDARRTGSPSG